MTVLRRVVPFTAGMALALGLIILLPSAGALPNAYSPYRKLNIFARVLTYVENNYVEHVDDTKLIYGAIRGMMGTLDPHSAFLTPEEYREMKADTSGEFGGLGIEVELRNGVLTVVAPIEGTPAHRAGIRTGDEIREIEGKPTKEMQMHEAVRLMRGPRGTRVRLGIHRPGEKELIRLEVMRDVIKIISVSMRMIEPGIGLVRLKSFPEGTDTQLRKALQQMTSKEKLRGLILDMRNNPGGLLDQAVRVADLFIKEGLLVSTAGKGGRVMDEERAHSRGTFIDFPMVCLVNGGSASASEIVAGALQDHRRAVIMGLPTFGKGSVQTIIDLKDGSAIKLTVARYHTPRGRSIQEMGIEPDILVEEREPRLRRRKVTREKDLQRHLPGKEAKGARRPQARLDDFQLETAVGYLKAAEIFRHEGR